MESPESEKPLAIGEFFAFLNSDAVPEPGAVEAALRHFDDPAAGVVGGQVLSSNGDLQEAGSIIWANGLEPYGQSQLATLPQYEFRRPVDYCSTAFLFTRRIYVPATPTLTPFGARKTFLFIGAMHSDANPNADSMTYFCRQIWPEIRRRTGAEFVIAGYGTDRFLVSDFTVLFEKLRVNALTRILMDFDQDTFDRSITEVLASVVG